MSTLSRRRLHEFDPIPKGIVDVDSVATFQALVLPHFIPPVAQLLGKLAQATMLDAGAKLGATLR